MNIQYPQTYAGQQITPSLLTSMEAAFAVKAAPTSTTSSTTVVADPDLTFPLVAGGIYIVEFYIVYEGLLAAGFQTVWGVPTGTTGTRTAIGPGSASNNTNGDNIAVICAAYFYNSTVHYGVPRNSVTSQQTIQETSVVTAGSAGNVAIQWAQVTSTATATTVTTASWGRCTRLA